jgi:hypothetical protein
MNGCATPGAGHDADMRRTLTCTGDVVVCCGHDWLPSVWWVRNAIIAQWHFLNNCCGEILKPKWAYVTQLKVSTSTAAFSIVALAQSVQGTYWRDFWAAVAYQGIPESPLTIAVSNRLSTMLRSSPA